jgi:hypothetical protein
LKFWTLAFPLVAVEAGIGERCPPPPTARAVHRPHHLNPSSSGASLCSNQDTIVNDDDILPSVREGAEPSDLPFAEGNAAQRAHPNETVPLTDKVDVEPATRCIATSKSGRSCTNLAAYADQRCLFHSSDPVAVAAKTAGRSKGGAVARRTTVVGLGLPDPEVDGITVGDSAGQLAVLGKTRPAGAPLPQPRKIDARTALERNEPARAGPAEDRGADAASGRDPGAAGARLVHGRSPTVARP